MARTALHLTTLVIWVVFPVRSGGGCYIIPKKNCLPLGFFNDFAYDWSTYGRNAVISQRTLV
jgi:hypothetical protein